MNADEMSNRLVVGAAVPIRAPAWPGAMGAASLAVAATYLGQQLWVIHYRGFLTESGGTATAKDVLMCARNAPDLLLILAAPLLLLRKRAGAFLHISYAVAAIAVGGGTIVLDVTGIVRTLYGATGTGFAAFFFNHIHELVRMIYPVCVLIWFARPRIVRQLRDWDGLVASPVPAEPGFRYANRVWPSVLGAASISFGAIALGMFFPFFCYTLYEAAPDPAYLWLKWYWIGWLGRLDIPEWVLRLMPGAFGISLILGGIALVRRWWAAVPLHLAAALLMPAFILCVWNGMPWDTSPRFGAVFLDLEPLVHCLLMSTPMFTLYPLVLLVWFCRPGVWKQAFAWHRVTRRRNRRRGRFGRILTASTRVGYFAMILLLPVAAAIWRCVPKPPLGVEFFGQALSLPTAGMDIPLPCDWNLAVIVCVGADGAFHVDGRQEPSLDAMREAIAEAKRKNSAVQTLLAVDQRTPFSQARPVFDMCTNQPLASNFLMILVRENQEDFYARWMDDLAGGCLVFSMSSPTSPSTTPIASSGPRTRIEMAENGDLTIDGQGVDLSRVSTLQPLVETPPGNQRIEAHISVDGNVPFGQVVAVINECKLAGVSAFTFSSLPETRPATTQPATR